MEKSNQTSKNKSKITNVSVYLIIRYGAEIDVTSYKTNKQRKTKNYDLFCLLSFISLEI